MRHRPPPCQTPNGPHALTRARLYPSGWECDRHAPWARLGLPKPCPDARAAAGYDTHHPCPGTT